MGKRFKKPYCVCYQVKDRFGHKAKVKATFDTWSKAQNYALRVSRVENNTNGGSAKLLSWGTNK